MFATRFNMIIRPILKATIVDSITKIVILEVYTLSLIET